MAVLTLNAASPRVQWLLALGVFCMVAQATLLPFTSPSTDVWTPVHKHITFNGVVPAHTHAYDRPAGIATKGPACVVDDSLPGSTHNEPLVCAPGTDGATGSVVIAVQHEPSVRQLAPPGIESLATMASGDSWQSVVLPILTPPPRS